jgi:hypothetical protein
MFDLNTLIAPGSSLYLQVAQGINDRGEIAGSGVDAGGSVHSYLLVPCNDEGPSGCQEVVAGAPTATFSTPASPTEANSTPRLRWVPRRLPGPLLRMQGH